MSDVISLIDEIKLGQNDHDGGTISMINQKGGPGGRSLTGGVNTLQFMAMMMIMINAAVTIPLFPANLLLETEDFEVCTFFIHRGSGSIFYLKSFFLC